VFVYLILFTIGYPLIFQPTKDLAVDLSFALLASSSSLFAVLFLLRDCRAPVSRREWIYLILGGALVGYVVVLVWLTYGFSLALVVLTLLPFALYFSFVAPRTPWPIPRSVRWSLLALLSTAGISCLFTHHQQLALVGYIGRPMGYATVLSCAILYLGILRWCDSRGKVLAMLGAVLCAGVTCSLIAIWQFSFRETVAWKYFMELLSDPRPAGTVGHPNYFGNYLCLILPLAVGIYLFLRSRWLRVLLLVVCSLLFAALLLAQTRGAYLGFFVFFVFLAFSQLPAWKRLVPLFAAWALVAVVVLPLRDWEVGKRVLSVEREVSRASAGFSSAGTGRFGFWKYALHHLPQHIIIGSGLDTYEAIEEPGGLPAPIGKAHSIYFEYALTIGVPGLLAYLAFVVSSVSGPIRGDPIAWGFRGSVVAYLVQGGFIHDTIQVWPVLWIILALASIWSGLQSRYPVRPVLSNP